MSKAKNIHEITIEISGDEWKTKLDETFKKVIKKVKIDGFRPGKAPRSVYEKKYGIQSLVVEAVEDNMDEAYKKALEKFTLMPIIQPTVALDKADEEGVIYKFTFTTKPEVKINKYTGLNIKEGKVKVTDKDVEEEIEKRIDQLKKYPDVKFFPNALAISPNKYFRIQRGMRGIQDTIILSPEDSECTFRENWG